jgi:S1-C subfamily serine protease
MRLRHLSALAILGAFMSTASPLLADEGMWLFNAPPLKQLKENYNFEPTKEWLEHLQKSSVRFNSGGSGSFVSKTGLVMTNHHVGALNPGKELPPRWLPREDERRGTALQRPRTQRVAVDQDRDRRGQWCGEA